MTPLLIVQVCSGCGGADHQPLGEALADLPGVRLVGIQCDEACEKPAQLWLQQPGGAAYAFEGLDFQSDAGDIAATARAYLASPKGWIEDARPCGRLRYCLAARVPA